MAGLTARMSKSASDSSAPTDLPTKIRTPIFSIGAITGLGKIVNEANEIQTKITRSPARPTTHFHPPSCDLQERSQDLDMTRFRTFVTAAPTRTEQLTGGQLETLTVTAEINVFVLLLHHIRSRAGVCAAKTCAHAAATVPKSRYFFCDPPPARVCCCARLQSLIKLLKS